MSPQFVTFGTAHLVAAVTTLALAISLPWWLRRRLDAPAAHRLGRVLSVVLVAHELLRIVLRSGIYDQPLAEHLPLHLCGVSLLVAIITLWRKRATLFPVLYFWGLGGLTAALVTPDIAFGFPHLIFITFFTGHGLVLASVFYTTFVYGFRPTLKSLGIAFAALAGYALVIYPVNKLLGANFLYLAHKPAQASPIDYLGPWPYYIGALGLVALAIFIVCWLPFAIVRHDP